MGAGVVIKDLYPARQFSIPVPSAFLQSDTPASPAATPPGGLGRGGTPAWPPPPPGPTPGPGPGPVLVRGLAPVSVRGRSHLALN